MVKIVGIGERSSLESVPQSVWFTGRSFRVKLTSRPRNTERIVVVCYNVSGLAGLCHEGFNWRNQRMLVVFYKVSGIAGLCHEVFNWRDQGMLVVF